MPPGQSPTVLLITGIQAAGKSTVAQKVAEALPRSVHLRGDLFRRMIVNDRADYDPDNQEWEHQLSLRYRLAASCADGYAAAGFTVVLQDIIIGAHLIQLTHWIKTRPLQVAVLAPRPEVVARREAARSKTAYSDSLTVEGLDRDFHRETPRIGVWIDSSAQSADETAAEILRRVWTEGRIT